MIAAPYRTGGSAEGRPAPAPVPGLYRPISAKRYRLFIAARVAPWLLGVVHWCVTNALGHTPGASAQLVEAGLILTGVAIAILHRLRLASARKRMAPAFAMAEAGQLAAAGRTWDGLISEMRGAAPVHAVLVMQRAHLLIRQKDPERAFALLCLVHESGWLTSPAHAYAQALLRVGFARVCVARGRLDEALAWQTRAHLVVPDTQRIELLSVDALIDLKSDRYAEGLARLEIAWPVVEALLKPRQQRLLALMRAFAIESTDVDSARDGEVRAWVEAARPLHVWDIDYLREGWPKLSEFLSRHGLPDASPSAVP